MDAIEALRAIRAVPHRVPGAVLGEVADDVRSRIDRLRTDTRRAALTGDANAALDEALRAIIEGFFGASVVLTWGVVMDTLHELMWRDQFAALNGALGANRTLRVRDAIRDIYDDELLRKCNDLQVLNRAQFRRLSAMLSERNHAGHVAAHGFTAEFALGFVERALVACGEVAALRFP